MENRLVGSGKNYEQNSVTYYVNGNKETESHFEYQSRYEKLYWSDGTIKSEKHYENELLNGIWLERDSTGKVTKNCKYKDGFRSSNNCTFEMPALPSVTTTERKLLRRTVAQMHACTFYDDTNVVRITRDQIDVETEVLCRLYSYHKFYGKEWPLDTTVRMDAFTYSVMIPEGIYLQSKEKIEKLFHDNGWKPNLKLQNGYASGNFTSSDFYNLTYFDAIFGEIFGKRSGYIGLNGYCRGELLLDVYFNDIWTLHSMKKIKEGYLIETHFRNAYNRFTIYSSGEIELYNGIGTPPELLMTEQEYINIPKW
jgi:hypothetical protein